VPIINGVLTVPDGAVVEIEIGVGQPQRQNLRRAGRPIPAPIRLRAPLDSGAQCTFAEPTLLQPLALEFAGANYTNAPGLGGLSLHPQSEASLTILHPSGARARHLTIDPLPILELPVGAMGYEAVIGRDVLALCVLVFDGPTGRFTLAY
jgi:hypothetical protein